MAQVSAMSGQHKELLALLSAATSEAQAARRAASAALEEGRKRDALVLTNRQLESARHFDRMSQVRQFARASVKGGEECSTAAPRLAPLTGPSPLPPPSHSHAWPQDKELRRLQAAHEVQLSAMHRELHRISELMATNALQAEQLHKALHTIRQLKVSHCCTCACLCWCLAPVCVEHTCDTGSGAHP